MRQLWTRCVKWLAGKMFTWGLRKLTELTPADAPKVTPRRRTTKKYTH